MQRGFACNVKSTKLPFSSLLLRLLVKLVLLPAVSKPVRETAQERRRRLCFSSRALYGSSVKESAQPSPALSSLTHSFIRDRDESAQSRH